MTRVTFYKFDDRYIGYEFSGHADLAEYGEDILCSAISILSFTCTNTILHELKLNATIEEDEEIGYVELIVQEDLEVSIADKLDLVIRQMKIGIDGLKEQYPKHMNIEIRRLGWLN